MQFKILPSLEGSIFQEVRGTVNPSKVAGNPGDGGVFNNVRWLPPNASVTIALRWLPPKASVKMALDFALRAELVTPGA